MLRNASLFDILRSKLVAVFEEYRDDMEAETMATRILENDGDKWLIIGLTKNAKAVVTYDRLTNSVNKTPILSDRLDGNGKRQIDRRRTEGQVLEALQGLGSEFFAWVHPRYRWVFESDYRTE